jgi:hypothetical protein
MRYLLQVVDDVVDWYDRAFPGQADAARRNRVDDDEDVTMMWVADIGQRARTLAMGTGGDVDPDEAFDSAVTRAWMARSSRVDPNIPWAYIHSFFAKVGRKRISSLNPYQPSYDDEHCGLGVVADEDTNKRIIGGMAHYLGTLEDSGTVARVGRTLARVARIYEVVESKSRDDVIRAAANMEGMTASDCDTHVRMCVAHYWLAQRTILDISVRDGTASMSVHGRVFNSSMGMTSAMRELHDMAPADFAAFACIDDVEWYVVTRDKGGLIRVLGGESIVNLVHMASRRRRGASLRMRILGEGERATVRPWTSLAERVQFGVNVR